MARLNGATKINAPYRVTVGVAAVQLTSNGTVHGQLIKALCPGQTIYIGRTSAVTTLTGYPLADMETLTLEVADVSELWAIADAAAQEVAILPYKYL